jgi:hypothetical protein
MSSHANPLPAGEPTRLRDMPLPVRLVLGLFLVSVGYGYVSALVQLHFQEASAGEILPTKQDVIDHYHGKRGMGQLERLIVSPEHKPFNAGGSMRKAFTSGSAGWVRNVREFGKLVDAEGPDVEKRLRAQRALEAAGVVAWIHDGGKKETYASFQIPANETKPFTDWMAAEKALLKEGADLPLPSAIAYNEAEKTWTVEVSSIIENRCARCHNPNNGGAAGQIHLDNWENVRDYIPPVNDPAASGMSYAKLAQSTHVHLLGFSMLYGLTGLLFAFTNYPLWLRVLLAPLPLLAQVVDISFWWLARMDAPCGPMFASLIIVSGGVVGMSLLLQIVLGLFALFGSIGRVVIVLAMLAVAGGGHFFLKPLVEQRLDYEKNAVTVPVESKNPHPPEKP